MSLESDAAAKAVTHEDQLENWAQDLLEAILPWLKEPESYDDKVQLARTVKDELRDVVLTAFRLAYSE